MKIFNLIKGIFEFILMVLFYLVVGALCLFFLPVILLISLLWG